MRSRAVAEVGGWMFLPPLLFAVLLPFEAKTGLYLIVPVWGVLYMVLFRRVWRTRILHNVHWLSRAMTLNLGVTMFMAGWFLLFALLGRVFSNPAG